MRRQSLLLILLLLGSVAFGRTNSTRSVSDGGLHFIENKGQIRDQDGHPRTDIDFILQSRDMTLYIGDGALHYQFVQAEKFTVAEPMPGLPGMDVKQPADYKVSRLDVSLKGADKGAPFITDHVASTKYHYYNTDERVGVTGARAFDRITYRNIYPGIDWVLYTEGNTFKYDFILHPGAQVSAIVLAYEGANSLLLEKNGSLSVDAGIGSISESAPYIYEQKSKKQISGQYILEGKNLSYQVGDYAGTLVIDPGVDWATYFGGDGVDGATAVATDVDGNVYLTGKTKSLTNVATTGAHQTSFSGVSAGSDSYLAKFDSLGQLEWATYYGGTATSGFYITTEANAIATDDFGHVYVTGITAAENGIATPGSFQPTRATNAFFQGFLVQFNSDGVRQWGTYYGASVATPALLKNATMIYAAACDGDGNVYIGGQTDSLSATTGSLVTTGAHQTVFGGGDNPDALLVKFDSSGNREWATYYGGEQLDVIHGMTCDDSNNLYVTGTTYHSTNGIASPDAWMPNDDPQVQGFVTKFNSSGVRQWGTYVHTRGVALAVDQFHHLYLTGFEENSGIPDTLIYTPGCHQFTLAAAATHNSFLMRLDPVDGYRVWGTYYGADRTTKGAAVACDNKGNVYMAGQTNSYAALTTETIATAGSHQDTLGGTPGLSNPPYDLFIAQFDSTGVRKWASYYGGEGTEAAPGLACDPSGVVYLSGSTQSASGIASTGAYQNSLSGTHDGFLVRWLPVDIAITSRIAPEQDTACMGDVPFVVSVKNQGRLDKEDTLKISYTFSGPSTGSLDTFFTGGLDAGMEEDFGLGGLDLAFPGVYDITVYLHYTRDDNERLNDTLHFSLTTTNAEPVAEISMNQVGTVYHFSNPSGQPSDSYHWDFGDGNTSNEANPSHSYAETDSYLVTLIVTGFCGSDTATLMVEGIGDGSGISDPALAAKLSVYPNPANDRLFIKMESGLRAEAYRIVNVLGQELLSGKLEQSTQLDIRGLAAGSYFLHVRTDKGMVSKAFQVLKR